ncbi:DUF4329 domain-containing protein [Thalassococcus sp. S3]|uniref:DUF4329 domain-containing protein n=1 Tax=Thalassococcus sp. S3 TaxID=2017482 RepID=UPI0010241ACE|nr:DUF4329 domain-containing protein [Thalassococcus sp. S3]QBF30569.1 hypothetical protein CFI11_04990 [Thalassococcus sp. S3]
MRMLGLLLGLLVLVSPVQASDAQVEALAKQLLRELQAKSIKGNREYCGLIGRRPDGSLVSTRVARGQKAQCRYPLPDPRTVVVASFHTHGAFLKRYDNEVPSLFDVLNDMTAQSDGYVSTPGGRFWHIDGETGTIRLLCGPKCLPWDPRYVDGATGFIAGKYTLQELKARQ